jgi:hypothetical protein
MPTHDAFAGADSNGSGPTTSTTTNLTVANQLNRCAWADLCTDNQAVSSITMTCDGQAMTLVDTYVVNGQNIYRYRRIAPTVGVIAVAANWTTSAGFAFAAWCAYGVHQTTPERNVAKTGGNTSANPSLGVTSETGDLVYSLLNLNNDDTATSAGGQTRVGSVLQGGNGITAAYLETKAGASGTVTLSWTAAAARWSAMAMSIQAPAGGVVIPVIQHHRLRH